MTDWASIVQKVLRSEDTCRVISFASILCRIHQLALVTVFVNVCAIFCVCYTLHPYTHLNVDLVHILSSICSFVSAFSILFSLLAANLIVLTLASL